MTPVVYLSRRNLLTLLSKLDRKAMGEATQCTLLKNDNRHPVYPASMPAIKVVAIEDAEYYVDRPAGEVHPKDDPSRKGLHSAIVKRVEVV